MKTNPDVIESAFKILLFLALLLSAYMFFMVIVMKSEAYKSRFSTWQFPMLLALFMDIIYLQ